MVPNRRPPRPHSCSRSRSPLRQCAAAKPSQVMNPNSAMKMIRAVQLTSATAFPLQSRSFARYFGFQYGECPLIVSREINDRGQDRPDDHPEELVPVEERHAGPRWLDRIVEGRPQHSDKLNQKKQIPPAPFGVLAFATPALLTHGRPRMFPSPVEL